MGSSEVELSEGSWSEQVCLEGQMFHLLLPGHYGVNTSVYHSLSAMTLWIFPEPETKCQGRQMEISEASS